MSSAIILFQQMIMLFVMIGIGYYIYKKEWVSENSAGAINKIVVYICNPMLMLSSVINPTNKQSGAIVLQNIETVLVYFVILIIISIPVAMVFGKDSDEKHKYQMMTIFSNVGFMGIPLAKALLGNEAVFLVVFYGMTFNVLIYTLGVHLAKPVAKENSGVSGIGKSLKSIFTNIGVLAAILAIVVFLVNPTVPGPIDTFVDYFGNMTIPLSMMSIGFSLAKLPVKDIFSNKKQYAFTFTKMLVIPILVALVYRALPVRLDYTVQTIFFIEIAMPVASMCTMMVREYGEDKGMVSIATALTTLVSLVTIPIVLMFVG